ncbi:MAG: hypothetical protein HS132_04620 [Planctomycetia bacterium]|nr:hypothetical protein [Planctomycetia bacterium]
MKNILIIIYLCLITNITSPVVSVQARPVLANAATSTASAQPAQPSQIPVPELPPTPRSKLEIIQYILLPFAIGASIWLLLRLEKMEREKTKSNEEQ